MSPWPRIALLMQRYSPAARSHWPDIVRLLREWGATADPVCLADTVIDVARLRADYDLHVLQDESDLALRVGAALHGAGAALLNPYPVSAMLRDKIVTCRVLQAVGVPVPETFLASQVQQLEPALERGPLVVKPYRGSRGRGRGIRVVRDAAELAALGRVGAPLFAQRYHAPEGLDRRIYSIGSELLGVLRLRRARTPFTLSPELADISRRCGAAFGIDLFSVDIVESGGQAYVIDMGGLPGFNGVPDAPPRLARYIYAAAQRAARGEPIGPPGSPATNPQGGNGALKASTLELVQYALSTAPATPQELKQIEKLLDEIRVRADGPVSSTRPRARRPRRDATPGDTPLLRVALYAPGMVGFGHLRRNTSIAQALRGSSLQPAILMVAEAWQTGAIPLPAGVDCVTLPGLRKQADGVCNPRFLTVSDRTVIALRAKVIESAVQAFAPDVLIVDHLPLGAARELTRTLERLRKRGNTRCVLGLRDVLHDPETVRRTWAVPEHLDAAREFYDAVWIYGDPAVYDAVREYDLPDEVVAKVRYTGYLDQRPRLELARQSSGPLLATLPPGRLVLCVVGGGHDGAALAAAFSQAELPPQTTAVVVTGFVAESVPLIERADRVIAMGGYNTVCEVLSFGKHALIVPRAEQRVRAERLRDLGLLEVLPPDRLSPRALTEWLARDLGPSPDIRRRIDLGGLERIPRLLTELLSASAGAVELGARA